MYKLSILTKLLRNLVDYYLAYTWTCSF